MKAKQPDFSKEFSNLLKTLRQERGWSQGQLAKKIHSDLQRISKYERGVVYPTTDMIVKLAGVFQVSVDYLLRGDNASELKPVHHPEISRRMEAISQLPSKDQDTLIDLIDAYIKRRKFENLAKSDF